jgi:prophage regulatory protein
VNLEHPKSDAVCEAIPGRPRDRLLRLEQVKEVVGLGKTLIYRMINTGQFPSPYKPGGFATRWSENEILEWLSYCSSQRAH